MIRSFDIRLLAIGLLVFAQYSHAQDADHESAPSHLGLLIGISEYDDPTFADLEGPLNDVEAMSSVLIGRFSFPPNSLTLLTDGAATRDNILGWLMHSADIAGPETIIVIYFSGHGSSLKALAPKSEWRDDPDVTSVWRWSDTLVPSDSGRGRQENRDITDDELEFILGTLATKTKNVTLIIDAALGGVTQSRGFTRIKSAPADYRERNVYKTMYEMGYRNEELPTDDVTIIVAGESGEQVIETTFGDPGNPIASGVFSYYLSRHLWEADVGGAWPKVLDQVSAAVATWSKAQPAIFGGSDTGLFHSVVEAPKTYFEVISRKRDLLMRGGLLHGLSVGSTFDVFPPDTTDFSIPPLASVRLSSVDLTTSIGDVVEGAMVDRGWAVPSSIRFEKSKLRVRLDLSKGSALEGELVDRLEMSDLVELVDAEYDVLVRETQGELHVEGASSSDWRTVTSLDDRSLAVESTLEIVEQRAQSLSLTKLANPQAPFQIGLELFAGDRRIARSSGPSWVREGERVSVRVTNENDVPVYLLALGLTDYEPAQKIYPGPAVAPYALRPQEYFEFDVLTTFNPDRPNALDVIKVIASTEPIGDVNLGTSTTRGIRVPNSFDQLLDYRARGSLGEISVDPRTWSTASAQLQVIRGWILWVDDNPQSNSYVRDLFSGQGWLSITAKSTEEALKILDEQKFDIVISDFSRPNDKLAGYHLLDMLKDRDDSPPLIYYVGKYTTEQALEARARGALAETNSANEILRLMEKVRQTSTSQ